jgi:hypothetical protein
MRRRKFGALLGGAATASAVWPSRLRAQKATPVVGYLGIGAPQGGTTGVDALRQGLSEIGYVERHNLMIEHRWAEGRLNRLRHGRRRAVCRLGTRMRLAGHEDGCMRCGGRGSPLKQQPDRWP